MLSTSRHSDSRRSAARLSHVHSFRAFVLGALTLLLSSISVLAADDELEQIVVTAQRREQSIQDVPLSITAFSGDQLRSLGITTSTQIAEQTPGLLLISPATGSTTTLPVIRGVTQNDYSVQQEPPIAAYVDDAYIASSAALGFSLFDVNRVEVLRGPQGTLFGRNATGGAIQYVSNAPSQETNGYVDAAVGSYETRRFEAAIGGSINDRVLARIAAVFNEHGPWWQNNAPAGTIGGNSDSFADHFIGTRAQLKFLITDSLDDSLIYTYGDVQRHAEGVYKSIPGALNSQGLGYDIGPNDNANGTCPGCDAFGYRDPNLSKPFQSSFASVGYLDKRYSAVTNRLLLRQDAFSLTSITNYQFFTFDYLENCDGTPYAVCEFLNHQRMHQLSEEVRLNGESGPLTWTAGVFYLDISEQNHQGYGTNVGPTSPFAAYAFVVGEDFPQTTRTAAVFGQTEYKFLSDWTLITGLRVSHDHKELTSSSYFPDSAPFYEYSAANGDQTVESKTDWAGKLEVDWKPIDQLLLYAGVTRGNKGPGFNGTPTGALPAGYSVPFKSEELTDYETGWKWSSANNRLRINGSVYYYDYKDYQGFEYNLLTTIVVNKDAHLYGGELEVSASPGDNWTLSAGISAENGVVDDVRLPLGEIVDRTPPQMPHFTANGLVRKTFDLFFGKVSFQADGQYVGQHFAALSNAPTTSIPGAALFNARLSYEDLSEHWDASFAVRNLANRGVVSYAFDLAGSYGLNLKSYDPPRWYTVDVRYRF